MNNTKILFIFILITFIFSACGKEINIDENIDINSQSVEEGKSELEEEELIKEYKLKIKLEEEQAIEEHKKELELEEQKNIAEYKKELELQEKKYNDFILGDKGINPLLIQDEKEYEEYLQNVK